MKSFNTNDLAAYLDEGLPVETMAAVEDALRQDPQLAAQLAQIIERRDAGVHSLGEIWRRNRLSCPSRQQLGSHLLGVLSTEESDYIVFHIDTIGCRYCQANHADLKHQHAAASSPAEQLTKRRRKYFQSSAGYLKTAKR